MQATAHVPRHDVYTLISGKPLFKDVAVTFGDKAFTPEKYPFMLRETKQYSISNYTHMLKILDCSPDAKPLPSEEAGLVNTVLCSVILDINKTFTQAISTYRRTYIVAFSKDCEIWFANLEFLRYQRYLVLNSFPWKYRQNKIINFLAYKQLGEAYINNDPHVDREYCSGMRAEWFSNIAKDEEYRLKDVFKKLNDRVKEIANIILKPKSSPQPVSSHLPIELIKASALTIDDVFKELSQIEKMRACHIPKMEIKIFEKTISEYLKEVLTERTAK